MNVRHFVVGFGAVCVGLADAIVYTGINRTVGQVAILVGAVIIVWGFFADPDDSPELEPMVAPLPGRLCNQCGKMTSLDSSTCKHCGASLLE
jgi:hypothetical protein